MILKTEKIIKEWTDYNKHMNVAYYIHVFDISADVMLDNFKMGGESAKKDKKSTFVVEMHTHYNQEVKLGEEVETHLTYIDHDKKRIQYKLSMFHKEKKYLAATNEVLSLYVDLSQRRVTEFDPDRVKIMDDFIKNYSSKFNFNAFSLAIFKNSIASNSFSPLDFLIAFKVVFRKIFVFTPGISNGYWKAKNIPLCALSSIARSNKFLSS